MNPKVNLTLSDKKDPNSFFAPIPVEGRVYCDICEERKTSLEDCKHHAQSPLAQHRGKLLILGVIAALALFSICIIAEELISRRFQREARTLDSRPHDFYEASRHVPSSPLTTENGLYWSTYIQAAVSPGLNDIETDIIMKKLREKRVEKSLQPDWLHCGRDKNRYVIFEDGSEACARNREDLYIQGEVMAFYLARFLGIRNTPAVVLSKLSSKQWQSVGNVEESIISNGTSGITALIQWIPNLVQDTMPSVIRERILPYMNPRSVPLPPLSGKSAELHAMSNEELSTLIQWGDMIIFDYLTGNYDRLVSMQDAALREGNPSILRQTINNLVRSTDTSSLWLIDNESAFLEGYSRLYTPGTTSTRFLDFHAKALGSLCVFRGRTIQRLGFLESSEDPAELLLRFIHQREPLFKELGQPLEGGLFAPKFKERILEVMEWFRYCKERAPLVMV